jgi:hypothetical protein
MGRKPVLNQELENLLADYILRLEGMLIGLSRKDVMILAFQLAEANHIKRSFN